MEYKHYKITIKEVGLESQLKLNIMELSTIKGLLLTMD